MLCRTCGEHRPTEDFPASRVHNDSRPCRPCGRRQRAAWRSANSQSAQVKATKRREHLKRKYGITPEKFDEMSTHQNGACAACGSAERLVIDHDHETGAVRGLLCNSCNLALGLAGDSVDRLMALAAYLLQQCDVLVIPDEGRSRADASRS